MCQTKSTISVTRVILFSSHHILSLAPTDNNEKCIMGQGEGYRGTWSITHSGAECINWNATSLRGKKFTARRVDATNLGLGNHNFCRHVIIVIHLVISRKPLRNRVMTTRLGITVVTWWEESNWVM